MSPRRWRKAQPSPPVAEGQTEVFDADGFIVGEPKPNVVYICRECFSRYVTNVTPTVDPRWVIGLCADCGTRQIATVVAIPSRKDEPE
jgi:hypothetical protein